VQTATAYLETLNPEQRRAVEHGAAGGLAAAPCSSLPLDSRKAAGVVWFAGSRVRAGP
jgi:hypothetical protein